MKEKRKTKMKKRREQGIKNEEKAEKIIKKKQQ